MRQPGNPQIDLYSASTLDVYLLPRTPWEAVLALQHRLAYEIAGDAGRRAALVLCEHPLSVTVGRQGSRSHLLDYEDPDRTKVPVRWTNRGDGCWLQAPGQLAAYPIMPLDPDRLGLHRYRSALYQTLLAVLDEFKLAGEHDRRLTGVHIGGRQIAAVGVAVNRWIAYHGCWVNVCVDLERFDGLRINPRDDRRATSMFRELRIPVRVQAVRESFLRQFTSVFGFGETCFCTPPEICSLKGAARVVSGNH